MTNKRFLSGLLVIALVFGIVAIGCATQANVQESKPSINSVGTGFFITADGYIITCAHVVDDARVIGIWINDNRYRAELVGIDKDTDVAILKINHRPSRFFRLANFTSAKIGDRVYALGFPLTHLLGSEIRATDGIISALSGYRSDQTNFQVSAPIQPGNSGGPVLNAGFEVLGIASSKLNYDGATNVSFAVKNAYITSLLPHDVRVTGGNVRNMQDAISATIQIFTDDIFDGPPVNIVNNTGYNVESIYISQTASDVWGPNRLASNQILQNGGSISLNLPFALNIVNRYDIQLVDTNGNSYRQMDVQVTANGRIVFTAGATQSNTSSGTTLSGTYNYSSGMYITFNGTNYALTAPLGLDNSGTYRVSGNSIIFSQAMFGSDTWTILDSNTLRDPDNDLWRKDSNSQGQGQGQGGTSSSVIIVNNTGNSVYYVYISETTSDEWGPDRLASDQIISNNESVSVQLPHPINQVDHYDIRVRDSNNIDYVKWNVRVTANGRIVFTSADKQ